MTNAAVGTPAPDFELVSDRRERFRLSEQRGRPMVLFFYPQDDTEGCTIENIAFSQQLPAFESLGAAVVGISPDSVEDHCAFRDKYELGIILLADPDHVAIDAYGLWQPKKTFGREYVGLVRSTFLIAPDGTIAERWTVTRIKGHAEQVLEATRRLVAG
jgi:peroxiredoxin Q/BCP